MNRRNLGTLTFGVAFLLATQPALARKFLPKKKDFGKKVELEVALADPLELEGRPLLLDAAETVDDETLFHLLNLAQAPGGAVLLVSRDPPGSWSVALPDLKSRLNGLLVLGIQPPDDTVLAAMFRARFAERSLQPADDVIDYLIRRVNRSADSVERIVDLLDQAHAPVTRVLARKVLDESSDLFAPE